MRQVHITIKNRFGFHARASAQFCKLATTFKSDINLAKNHKTANGKNILHLMLLEARHGDQLELIANGEDEDLAIKQLVELIEKRFNEPE